MSRRGGGRSADVLVTDSRIAVSDMDLNKVFASSQVCTRLRRASASLRFASIAAGGDPRATIKTIGCILYSKLLASGFSEVSLLLAAAATSFSPTCRLSLNRPRIRLDQAISARMRSLSVSGRMPELARDLVS